MKRVEKIRMDLHQIPEEGRCEYKTKAYLKENLQALSCTLYEPTETSIVAYFNANQSKTICFRADMDGLKITENTNLSFSSKHLGYMHACGHDGHMAMLLDFAMWADTHKQDLTQNIACLFQASEEEHAGAVDILKSGILEQLQVEELYAFHIWPMLKKNQLFTLQGPMLASSSEVNIQFHGASVHAANREQGIDALKIASQFILDAYQEFDKIQSRHLLSFGTLHSGLARNIVSDTAKTEATMRNFDDATFHRMKDILFNLKEKYEQKTHIRIELEIQDLYKSVINDSSLIEKFLEPLQLHLLSEPYLQAEDFGCYT
ncbi:MAG: amidohydrolase, partial [Anaeroplasmataceae bacterium]|nr:amidohydrolase [Anaeroplasmataceae bacterium]